MQTRSSTAIETGRASVNGIDIYYQVHGSDHGTPLVLLHGGGSTIDSDFGRVLPAVTPDPQKFEDHARQERGAHGVIPRCA